MRFMIIVKATQASEAGVMPSAQLLTEMGQFNEQLVQAGVMLAGEGLHPTSRGARVRFSGDQRTVIDGPFADTQEVIAGFWLWQVSSKEEAIEWVKQCPPMRGTVRSKFARCSRPRILHGAHAGAASTGRAAARAARPTAVVTRCWHRL